MIQSKVIADSISPEGKRITTLQLMYPRFIHSEFMTHRVFSRNASSSRAIPVSKMIEAVRTNPAMPIHWGTNIPGMQAKDELQGNALIDAKASWLRAAEDACLRATQMMELGLHKQVANRLLEPFQHIHVVLTATEFSNFFELRNHEDAQPEIRELAIQMKAAMDASKIVLLQPGEWHLPYVTEEDLLYIDDYLIGHSEIGRMEVLRRVSAARCCRVSYLRHDGTRTNIEDDLNLCDRLIGSRPLHASPFEHAATPDRFESMSVRDYTGYDNEIQDWAEPEFHGNFVGWIQYRKLIESEFT